MKSPLVSVIVPVYNVKHYLERCIQSILDQTYTNLEVVAVNDGSTDGSLDLLTALAKRDDRLKIINKKNGGQSSARNLGLHLSSGEYLIMVDSDDYIDAHLIEKCLDIVEKTHCDLVLFSRFNLYSNGLKRYFSNGKGTTLVDAGTVPWNKFYRADLWKGLSFPEGYWYEDLGVVPTVTAKAQKIVNINEPLYYYQTDRESSQTNQVNALKFIDVKHMLDQVYDQLVDLGLLKKVKPQLEHLYIDQLVRITLLLKMPKVKDKKIRIYLTNEIMSCMDQKFADWRKQALHFLAKNGFKRILLYVVIHLYLKKFFILGDILWKIPKNIEQSLKKFLLGWMGKFQMKKLGSGRT